MLAVYKREMRSYFTSVIGYVFLVLYLAVGGAIFCFTTLYSMSADVTSFYLYMMIFSGIILPILTMKSFAEERKLRTEALLLTAPVPLSSMVLGKFFAALTMFGGAILVNSLYFIFLTPYALVKFAILLGNLIAVLLVGFLMGAPFGLGTVLVMVLQASIFQFACKVTRYEPRNVNHEDVLDTWRRITGNV